MTEPVKIVHFGGPASPYQQGLEKLAELVPEYKFDVVQAHHGQTELDALTSVLHGEVHGTIVTSGTLGWINPDLYVADLPYVFRDAQHAHEFWRSDDGRRLLRSVERSGLVVLACYDAGTRHFFNRVRPLAAPDDLAGLRIRVLPNPYHSAWVSVFGALPVEATPKEFRHALRSGLFDGGERSFLNLQALGAPASTPYISETAHFSLTSCLVVSSPWWSSLSAKERDELSNMALRSESFERSRYGALDDQARRQLEAVGTLITVPDVADFRAKAGQVYTQFVAATGKRALLDAALEAGW